MQSENTYTSSLITIIVLVILLISGPAEAVKLDITGLPAKATIGDIITFTFQIGIDTHERIPFEEIILWIDSTGCTYSLNGTLTPSSPAICSSFTLTKTQDAPYTYGYGYANDTMAHQMHYYGYGYGYGYGNTRSTMSYDITWDTKDHPQGPHTINITAKAQNHTYSSMEKTITLTTSPSGNSYSGNSGSQWTITKTLIFEKSPKLEIRSIQFPPIMHPKEQGTINVTIGNTGDRPYDVSVATDITAAAKTQTIAPGEESEYRFTYHPSDIGIHTAEITISSGATIIIREITFKVQEETSRTEESKDPAISYDDENELVTIHGCLNDSTKDLSVTIDGRMSIKFMLDKDNCFHITLSTAILDTGIHTLAIRDREGAIYENSFTIPKTTETPKKDTPTGNIIERYLDPESRNIALILSLIIISYALTRYAIKRRAPKQS